MTSGTILATLTRLFAGLILFCAAWSPAIAAAQLAFGPQNISASIDVETERPAPGRAVTVAIVMEPKPGWHDYWLNPADAGTRLELIWDLPRGVTAGPIRAPVPKTLMVSGFMNYVYERRHAFLIDLEIGESVPVNTPLEIKLEARWSACSDRVCVPEDEDFTLNLTTSNAKISEPDRARFDRYRAAIPPIMDSVGTFERRGDNLRLAVPYPASSDISDAYFFPVAVDLIDHSAAQEIRRTDAAIIITMPANAALKAMPDRITGLLRTAAGEGVMVNLAQGSVPADGTLIPSAGMGSVPQSLQSLSIWMTLAGALLGGLLLNLMPCVFPILGLKAVSLAKMGGNERAARRDAMAYSAGVILSCLILGLILLLLRAAGEQVGWAFQLQQPAIVLMLFLLLAAITANLAGMFEIGVAVSARGASNGAAGSFATGILAAVVATPCTGPFMAAALGAALLLPTWQALLLFSTLGLGLALPYLLIGFVPALRQKLPKPGAWMATFRKVMAVPMVITTAALGWLLWRLSSAEGLIIGGAALALIIAALLYVRRRQRSGDTAIAPALAALGIAAAAAFILPSEATPPSRSPDAAQSILPTEPFSAARLDEYRRNGRGVFVYFTADWCVTCKVNEKVAIERQATADAFRAKNIAVLRGDFTRKDPEIARMLVQYGSAGVPLYLWFAPGEKADILPQILTPAMLTELE